MLGLGTSFETLFVKFWVIQAQLTWGNLTNAYVIFYVASITNDLPEFYVSRCGLPTEIKFDMFKYWLHRSPTVISEALHWSIVMAGLNIERELCPQSATHWKIV